MIYRIPLIALLVLAGLLLGDNVLAYEEPQYTVVEAYEEFELREYDPYIVAEIRASGDFDEIGDKAFRKLFRYISEDERPQGKISMTVPVIQQPLPEDPEEKRYRFAFVMPSGYALDDLPKPENAEIFIREVPARLVAARRYSGTWSQERYRKNEEVLLKALTAANINTIGKPLFARYNAPFSLWFLRRNEVLIEVIPPETTKGGPDAG